MNKIFFLLFILILSLFLPYFLNIPMSEGYSNLKNENIAGSFPNSQTEVLLNDTYPIIGQNQISNENSSDMWWHYPIFKLGSYKQITNNIRYSNNPDVGTCMPGSMCGALYHEKSQGDNYVKQLPPVDPNSGTRVGYFTTDDQLIDSLPFRTDMQNILY